jgi:hypothetical protein
MGYHSREPGMTTLQKVLQFADIYSLLKKGCYDGKYSTKAFLKRLCAALELDLQLLKEEFEICTALSKEHEKVGRCSVFVDTNFHRTSQPIFMLAMKEGIRRLAPSRELLLFKTKTEILDMISEMVKHHYAENNGQLAVWGNIQSYIYSHFDGEVFVFDCEGSLLDDACAMPQPGATLSIGNKRIF